MKEILLNELIRMENDGFPVTSAYFTVSNQTINRKSHLVELKHLFKYKKNTTYFKQLSETEQQSVEADFEKILDWYNDGLDTSRFISSICFSSSAAGIWKTIPLKKPLNNELMIQPRPYIRPLTQLLSSYRNYAVVLVDKAKARVFESKYGDFKELFFIEEPEVESIKVGGFKGREERKAERSVFQTMVRHYKNVAQEIFNLNQKHKFPWLILGGRREAMIEFRKYLHDYVAQRIDGEVEVEPTAPLSDVLQKVQLTEESARQRYETTLLETIDSLRNHRQSVAGIQAVIAAMQSNQVATLLIQENYSVKGAFCRDSGRFSLTPTLDCGPEEGPVQRTQDIIEQVLHLAFEQNVVVEYIRGSMENYGQIGAILRYPLTR